MQIVRGSQIEFEPASHEDPRNPGVLKRVLASKDQLAKGQVMMVNWSQLPVGKSFQAHYHEDMQEVFIILNGSVLTVVSDIEVELSKGDAILIDPREVHQMKNMCDEPVEYVVFGISTEANGKTVVVESPESIAPVDQK